MVQNSKSIVWSILQNVRGTDWNIQKVSGTNKTFSHFKTVN